ncbi:MAG: hypothetical protein U5N56_08005 [Candidatus Marinimicrobia bacterium]|nr:hypothetical protein [Candidatus Neomarinimicrobiota bacterium]
MQKAVRRGDQDMTQKAINLVIQNGDFLWLRGRLAVITFEECWTYGLNVSFDNDIQIITDHFLNIASAVKNKNAAGLGSLAFEYSEGKMGVLKNNKNDNHIIKIADAIKDPKTFWVWANTNAKTKDQKTMIKNASLAIKKASWPWDKAFVLAGAYLAITSSIPSTDYLAKTSNKNFPIWVGIDKHTRLGKEYLNKAAKQLGVPVYNARWLSFYFESAVCNNIKDSPGGNVRENGGYLLEDIRWLKLKTNGLACALRS